MCWSWEVSLSFVIFQVLALGYITYRNKYIDRWYVLAVLPFAGQELCQFVLWKWGDIESVDPNSPFQCNDVNMVWSKILVPIAYLIPVTISLFAYKTSINSNICLQFMWKCWFYFQLITYFIIVPWMIIDKECVSVGPNNHQKWPPLMNPSYFVEYLGKWPTTIIISIFYYPAICLIAVFYKPLWIAWMPAIYSIVSIIILSIIIGDEAYSVWCWSCACITIWILIYVPISTLFIKKWRNKQLHDDEIKVDDIFGLNICSNIFFKDTQRHLKKYKMLDETQEMQSYSDINGDHDDEAQALRNHHDVHDIHDL